MPDIYNICSISEIQENTARGVSLECKVKSLEFFIIRKNNKIYGYINKCPHTGVNLDWKPDHFLDPDGNYIQCSTHGAKFRIEDGKCIYGPCLGQSLSPVRLLQRHNMIKLIQN